MSDIFFDYKTQDFIFRDIFLIYNLDDDYKNDLSKFILNITTINNLSIKKINKNKTFYIINNALFSAKIILKKEKINHKNNKLIFIVINYSDSDIISNIRENINNIFNNIFYFYSDYLISLNHNFFKNFSVYENKLRFTIFILMFKEFGETWWDDKVPKDISKLCKNRYKFDHYKFHFLFYSNFIDLKEIISQNWRILGRIFDYNKENLLKLNELSSLRNFVCHSRFLPDENFNYLMNFNDLDKIIQEYV
jgi:hypothetical protein